MYQNIRFQLIHLLKSTRISANIIEKVSHFSQTQNSSTLDYAKLYKNTWLLVASIIV